MERASEQGVRPTQDTLARALRALRDMRAQLDELKGERAQPVAIVGLSCRFPGSATTPDRYWQLLSEVRTTMGAVPAGRWDAEALTQPSAIASEHDGARHGCFLNEAVDGFDARFFRISEREALALDPQHRLLLELAWEAFESASLCAGSSIASRTGVFVGLSTSDYLHRRRRVLGDAAMGRYGVIGSAFSAAAGRIAHFMGLEGPCLAIDTACSSSLVAAHLAVRSLREGECRAALAGGVNLLLDPSSSIGMSATGALASDGVCRPFDGSATGYVRGEGGGLLVLKLLRDAVADGDKILAVIQGSAVNHGGRTNGLTVPGGASQQAVLRSALHDAGVSPSDVTYVESHGTGTPLGDPIEGNALAAVFGAPDRTAPLQIGSVKGNIGHLEPAAGVAGLIKLVLMLQRRQIPGLAGFQSLNPALQAISHDLAIDSKTTPWATDQPRIGGVSSFGIGGTNAHMVVTEPPADPQVESARRSSQLLLLSAATPTAMTAVARRMRTYLDKTTVSWGDVCATAANRSHLPWRLALVAPDSHRGAASLDDFLRGRSQVSVWHNSGPLSAPPPLAFFFPDDPCGAIDDEQVAAWPALSTALDQAREELAAIDPSVGVSANGRWWAATQPKSSPWRLATTWALARAILSLGIEPESMLGSGIGDLAAASAAGVLPVGDALRLAAMFESDAGVSASDITIELSDRPSAGAWISSAAGRRLEPEEIASKDWVCRSRPMDLIGGSEAIDPGTVVVVLGSSDVQFPMDQPESSTLNLLATAERPGMAGRAVALCTIARLHVLGFQLNLRSLFDSVYHRADLPRYPFERRKFWVDSESPSAAPKRSNSTSDWDADRAAGPANDLEAVKRYLLEALAHILGTASDELRPDEDLFERGLDSLGALELTRAVERDLDIVLHPRDAYERPRIDELASLVVSEADRAALDAQREPQPAPRLVPTKSAWPNEREKVPGIVLILCAPRSGSTLLRAMLAGHPGIFSPPELHLLPYRDLSERAANLELTHLDEGLIRALMELLGCDAAAARADVERMRHESTSVPEVYRRLRGLAGDQLLVDKSPTYTQQLSTLERAEAIFDAPRYIHLVRHPHSVIESFVRMRIGPLAGTRDGDPFEVAEDAWTAANRNVLDHFDRLAPDRCFRVVFEQLVTEPERIAGDLCEFLNVAFDPALLRPYDGDRMADGLTRGSLSIGDPGFASHESIDPQLAERWKEVNLPRSLSPPTVGLAEKLGYEFPTTVQRPSSRPRRMRVMPPTTSGNRHGAEVAVEVDDLTLTVCRWGDEQQGTPVLCLHGWLDQGAAWKQVASCLVSAGFPVLAPDLRGHGRSSHVGSRNVYRFADFVSDMVAVVHDLVGEPCLILGHSFGGLLASAVAATRPDLVRHVVVVDAPIDFGRPTITVADRLRAMSPGDESPSHPVFRDADAVARRLMTTTPALDTDHALELARRMVQSADEGVTYRWDARLAREGRACMALDIAALGGTPTLLQAATHPKLLVLSTHGATRWSSVPEESIGMPHGARVVLDGGHNLHLERPTELANVVTQWLGGAEIAFSQHTQRIS